MKILFSLLFALAACGVARACSCASPPAPKIALQAADAVFTGRVISVRATGKYDRLFVFDIAHAWKGKTAGKVAVTTQSNGSLCGAEFKVGQQYLVYATRSDNVLNTNSCSRTRHLNSAAADIAELNDPRPPALQPEPEPELILHSSTALGQMDRPLKDLIAALKNNPKTTRFRLFWPIGWQLTGIPPTSNPPTSNPPSGEKGGVTALYDRENSTFKFYASYLRYNGQSSQRYIKNMVYAGVTPEHLKQLAAKYQKSAEPLTNFSFFDRLPEVGAVATDLGSKIKFR